MKKNFALLLMAAVFTLAPTEIQARFSEDGITPAFRSMIAGKAVSTPEDLATKSTQVFLRSEPEGLNLFGDPVAQKRNWDSLNGATVNAFQILAATGTAMRGIKNAYPKEAKFKGLLASQAKGIVTIAAGSMGISSEEATPEQAYTIMRELISAGAMMTADECQQLEQNLFTQAKDTQDPAIQEHLQIVHFLIRLGANPNHIPDFSGKKFDADTQEALSDFAASCVAVDAIRRTSWHGNPQNHWATPGIGLSPLHASLNFARYPKVMSLGSHPAPTQGYQQTFSIVVRQGHNTVVIMEPEDRGDVVIRPHYGALLSGDTHTAEGTDHTTLDIDDLNGTKNQIRINWRVEKGATEEERASVDPKKFKSLADLGKLRSSASTVEPRTKQENDGTITPHKFENSFDEDSFGLKVTEGHKNYLFWCPTSTQIQRLKDLLNGQQPITWDDMLAKINAFDGQDRVPDALSSALNTFLQK